MKSHTLHYKPVGRRRVKLAVASLEEAKARIRALLPLAFDEPPTVREAGRIVAIFPTSP
jgi:hypothetical protein